MHAASGFETSCVVGCIGDHSKIHVFYNGMQNTYACPRFGFGPVPVSWKLEPGSGSDRACTGLGPVMVLNRDRFRFGLTIPNFFYF